jgi:hypothetical protein
MSTYEIKAIVDGQPTFEKPLASILSGLKVGGLFAPSTRLSTSQTGRGDGTRVYACESLSSMTRTAKRTNGGIVR